MKKVAELQERERERETENKSRWFQFHAWVCSNYSCRPAKHSIFFIFSQAWLGWAGLANSTKFSWANVWVGLCRCLCIWWMHWLTDWLTDLAESLLLVRGKEGNLCLTNHWEDLTDRQTIAAAEVDFSKHCCALNYCTSLMLTNLFKLALGKMFLKIWFYECL